jgi:putative Mg2+ transporter-C (MgtC) family protein
VQPKVRGLTTAACVWTAAGLGAAVGCGLWQMGLIGGVLTLVILSGVKHISQLFKILLGKSSRNDGENSVIISND